MELGFAGSFGEAGELGDLAVAMAFDIVQYEDGTGTGWQTGDGPFEIEGETGGRAMLHPVKILAGPDGHHPIASSALGAPTFEDHIGGQAVEPGAEGAIAPKRGELAPGPDKGFLGQLVGLCFVAREPQTEGVDPPDTATVDRFEGLVVAGLGAADPTR